MLEQDALVLATRDPDVGVLAFTWSVDNAAHHGDVDRALDLLEGLLHFSHHRQHVDLQAAAHRAGDQVGAGLLLGQGVDDAVGHLDLVHRGAGQRDTNGVADALFQQDTDADGALDRPGAGRSRLGHPEVQRVGHLVGNGPVGGDHGGRVRRLHRDLDQVEVERLEDVNVAQGGTDHSLNDLLSRRTNAGAFLGPAG